MLLIAYLHCLDQLEKSPDNPHAAFDCLGNYVKGCGNHIALHRPHIPRKRRMVIPSRKIKQSQKKSPKTGENRDAYAGASSESDHPMNNDDDYTSDDEPLIKRRKLVPRPLPLRRQSEPPTILSTLDDIALTVAPAATRWRGRRGKASKRHTLSAPARSRQASSDGSPRAQQTPPGAIYVPPQFKHESSRHLPRPEKETTEVLMLDTTDISVNLDGGDASHTSANGRLTITPRISTMTGLGLAAPRYQ